jgi:hypothetical protein
MKLRALREHLGTTRVVGNYETYIGVGSAMVHALIRIDLDPIKLSYSSAYPGREIPDDPELLGIWRKLEDLIATGEILPFIHEVEEVPNGVPVFWARAGVIHESVTECIAWRNITREGYPIYENTHFPTREEAIHSGIREALAGIDVWTENVADRTKSLRLAEQHLRARREHLAGYEALLPSPPPSVMDAP